MAEGFRRAVETAAVCLALAVVLVLALAAPATAAKTPAVCRAANSIGVSTEQPAAELPGSLEAQVLSSYSVFARPQVAADELPPVNTAGISLEFRMSSYYPGEIRQLLTLPNGRRFVAVPGFLRTFEVPPAICLPKFVRKHRSQLVQEEMRRRTAPAYCIVELGSRRLLGNSRCALFSEAPGSPNVFHAEGSAPVVEMVPNGVSSVRVVYPHGAAAVASVRENAFLLQVPAAIVRVQHKLERRVNRLHFPNHPTRAQRRKLIRTLERFSRLLRVDTEPVRVEWLDAGGALVKQIPRPHAGAAARLVILGTSF